MAADHLDRYTSGKSGLFGVSQDPIIQVLSGSRRSRTPEITGVAAFSPK